MKQKSKANDDIPSDLSGSVLIADFNYFKTMPSVDHLLRLRKALKEIMEANTKYPKRWYERELKAIDYLLSKHSR